MNTDAAIGTAAAQGKKLTLSVAVRASPKLARDLSRERGLALIFLPATPMAMELMRATCPSPGREPISAKWDAFVTAMGARYDSDPNVALVFITGMGQQAVEFHVTNTVANEKRLERASPVARWLSG